MLLQRNVLLSIENVELLRQGYLDRILSFRVGYFRFTRGSVITGRTHNFDK